MANNLVETIQKNLGLPPLQKIDPNIQEAKEKSIRQPKEKLSQAAIPAVLTALYTFTRTDKGCKSILANAGNGDSLGLIFQGKEAAGVDKVARYAGVESKEAESAMENIADEAIKIVRETGDSEEKIKTYMNGQRHNILVHLPAAMQLGDLLNEETLDDRTNKMEGPVSSFMHKIENSMSGSDKSKYP